MQNLKNEFFELIQKDISLFEQMQTQACDGFCYIDALQPAEKCWANLTFWKSLGYDISEISTISTNLFDVITGDEKTNLLQLLNQQFASKEPIIKQDISFTTKVGSKMWFRIKIILSEVHENVYRFLCFFTDISKLKQKEIILEHCNREAKIGYWEIDLTTQTPIWSEVTKQIHEVPDDFVPDLNTAINFYKEGRSRNLITQLVAESIETGKSYEVELELVTAKGNIRWVKAIGISEIVNGKCVKLYGLFQDIHDAKMHQEQIEAEKQKLNNVIDGTNVGTWEWNVQTGETVFNERWANIIGYTLEELSPISIETWLKFAHKDDLVISEKKLMDCFEGRSEYYACECRMKHKNGEWVWVFDRGKVFSWTEDGKPLMMFGTHQDITQSKLEAEKNKIFIQQAPNAIAMLDTNMVYIAASQQWIKDYNLSGLDIIGKSHYELLPEIADEWKDIFTSCLNGATSKNDEEHIKRKDGTDLWLKWDIRPWYTTANIIGGLVMCTEDITQRILAEQKLKISEEIFRGNFENSVVGMAILNDQFEWIEVNEHLYKMIGYSKKDLQKKRLASITYKPDVDVDKHLIESVIKGESNNYQIEKRLLHKNGTIISTIHSCSVVRNDQQQIVYILIQVVNITSLKIAENEVRQLLEVTKEQNGRLQNFAHIVSHNLRSHSVNISFLLDVLCKEQEAYTTNTTLQLLLKATNNLHDTIHNLNEVANINNSVQKNIPISLYDTTVKAVENVAALAEAAHVNIINQVPENTIINGIPAYVDSVLLNFLTNAIKYKSPEREAYIKINTKQRDQYVDISFEDNGLGIDLNRHGAKLFGMYKTFHNHPDARGIGLFITKNQVEAMGGKIEVESELNKGTKFVISLKA